MCFRNNVFTKGTAKEIWLAIYGFDIILLCSPIEFYQIYLDTKLVYLTNTIDFVSLLQADKLLIVFRERFDPRLTAAGFLSFLSYITALLF